jgi:hypothetical protein
LPTRYPRPPAHTANTARTDTHRRLLGARGTPGSATSMGRVVVRVPLVTVLLLY